MNRAPHLARNEALPKFYVGNTNPVFLIHGQSAPEKDRTSSVPIFRLFHLFLWQEKQPFESLVSIKFPRLEKLRGGNYYDSEGIF